MPSPRKFNRSDRRGTVMILFAMIVFLVMAIAGLVIDMGLVRVTQRQMQTATDSAAIEGLRGTDLLTEQERRTNASQMVAWTFDDNMNPQTVDNQYGAGPVLQLSGGFGDPTLAASQTLSVPAQHVYKPSRSDGTPGLELNLPDQASGDMVAGQFNTGQSATEANDFSRADFTPFNETNQPTRDAFLVRMRRTRNVSGLDQAAGVSSSGPTLPFLFALGSLIHEQSDATQNPNNYSPRQDGVSVRATAIAESKPALFVGPQDADLYTAYGIQSNIPQIATFALPSANWNSAASNGKVSTTGAEAVGSSTTFVAVGQLTTGSLADSGSLLPTGRLIVPLFATIDTVEVIVGFGLANSSGGTLATVTLTKQADFHALVNASASPAAIGQILDQVALPAGVDRTQFTTDLLNTTSSINSPLLSPVLVR